MSYIGGTLYAPEGFDIETFKQDLDALVQACLDVDEPSAIGKGGFSAEPIVLRIKSAALEPTVIEALRRSLTNFCIGLDIVVEAIGTQKIATLPHFDEQLDEAVERRKELRMKAAQLREERDKRDEHQRFLNSLSVDELYSHGYSTEAREREIAETRTTYSDPDFY